MNCGLKIFIPLIGLPILMLLESAKVSAKVARVNPSVVATMIHPSNQERQNILSANKLDIVAQFAPPEVAEQAKQVTVIINGQNPGSGVIIAKQNNTYFVLTAKHVVATEDEYEIVTNDGQEYILDYNTVRKLPEIDLALVEFTSNQSYPVAQIGDSDAATEGQGIYISGWPHPGQAITDRIFQITTGFISGRAFGVAEDGYELVYTNITRAGMSGGAVFDPEGRLIGIHGRAEGQAIYDPDTGSTIEIKSGFNLGIPIKLFITQIPQAELPDNPSFAYPLASWGSEFLRENQIDAGISSFNKALAIAPQSFLALLGMSQAKYQQGQMSEALRLVESALAVKPEDREIKSSAKWGKDQIEVTVKLIEALTIYQTGDRLKGLALASEIFANGQYPLEDLFANWPLDMASDPNPNYNLTGINDFLIAIVKEYIWSERLRTDAKEILTYLIPEASRSFAEKVFLGNIFLVNLSQNGTMMATGGDDNIIKVWDLASGNQVRNFPGTSEYLNSFVLSDDGKTLAIGDENGIKVWDIASGQQLTQIADDLSWVENLAMSPDGQLIAGVNNSKDTIHIWEIDSGTEVNTLSGYAQDVESIAFSRDRQMLAVGHDEGMITIWDWRQGQQTIALEGHTEQVSYLVWGNNDRTLASSGWDDSVKVWDLGSATELHSFPGWVSAPITLSPDGQTLVVGNTNAGIQLWNLQTGALMRTLRLYNPVVLKGVSFNQDGSQIVSVYSGIEENSPDWIKIWPARL